MLQWGWFHGFGYGFQPMLGKMLGSFGSQAGPQNATNIARKARKVLWEIAQSLENCTEKCLEVLAVVSRPRPQPISMGMFYGPSGQPSRGSSEEIFVCLVEAESIATFDGNWMPHWIHVTLPMSQGG